jgi:membrane dipeptidase
MISRRKLLIGGGLTVAVAGGAYWMFRPQRTPTGISLSTTELIDATELISKVFSIDVHAHPGRSFVANAENLGTSIKLFSAGGAYEEDTVADMNAGGLTMASFSTVSDFQVLGLGETGISAVREFEPGEAWKSYQTQMARLHEMLDLGLMSSVLAPDDLELVKTEKNVGAFLTAEGGDFLEGSIEHLSEAYADGLRSITLVHYHVNEIGDIQTAAPKHNGLTGFGKKLIQAMNQQGMLVDLAHASRKTAMGAIEASEKPIMISHSALRRDGFDSPRFIDLDQAKLMAEGGGIIGAWPAGIGLKNLSDFADQILRTIELIGADHVCLGTDMDANYKPVFDNYRQLPVLVGALLKRGLSREEATQFLGGNFMRVFREVSRVPVRVPV